MAADADWEREALRLSARYVDEVVLGCGLCPWAEPALRSGRVDRAVCLLESPRAEDCLPFVDKFTAARDPELDIGLLLFPRTNLSWGAFDALAERVRRAHKAQGAAFLVAAFHPDGAARAENAHQAVSFLRRTPDPMLQFVRAEVIDRVKANQPQASANVAEENFRRLPSGRLDELVRAIRADRDATYARMVPKSSTRASGASSP